jgi:hypothetical protein
VNDLCQRGEAVGRARRVAALYEIRMSVEHKPDDLHAWVKLVMVDAHDKHGRIGRRRRNQDALGATAQVQLGLFARGERASGLNDVISASFFPLDLLRLHAKQNISSRNQKTNQQPKE